MKDIIVTIAEEGSKTTWTEAYSIDDNADPTDYADSLIQSFNNTLRQGEKPRRLVEVEEGCSAGQKPIQYDNHKWEKQNFATVINANDIYDVYKCRECGITGKRHGLSSHVKRDAKYKAACYLTCEGALKQLEKNNLRKPRGES